VVCLGDFVGYGADPNRVLARFRTFRRPTIAIRGNHDKVACGLDTGETFNPPALEAARWTREKLSRENTDFLRRLPSGPALVDGIFGICHGSPIDEDSYIFSDLDASMNFLYFQRLAPGVPLCFFGHSHIPSIFTLDGDDVHVEAVRKPRVKLVLEEGKTYLVNPGSVGQPRDRNPRASYVIYDSDTKTVHFDRVSFDVDRARKKILRAGLPSMLGDRLVAGL
jgi:diadenosine tetraphosphatase ApaH/serine/threonine PP2A family protein phosphatase